MSEPAVRPPLRDPLTGVAILLAAVVLLVLALSACSAEGSTTAAASRSGSEAASTAGGDEGAEGIPPGTVLRVADQAKSLEAPLRLSGQLDDLPYRVEFSTFASGPLVNEALAAGAVDIGTMGDTPALLSFASGLDTVVVGVRANEGPGATLVASPKSGISSLDDLAGARVAYTTGTSAHGFLLRALDSVGLEESDIEQVDVPITDVANVLAADQADAAVLYELFRPPYVDEHPGAAELVSLDEFVPTYSFLLGRREAVEDPAKQAALRDLVGRIARSAEWVDENEDTWIDEYYVKVQKQTPEYGRIAQQAYGRSTWVEVGGDALAAQQEQSELLHEAGRIPEPVDLRRQFDRQIAQQFTDAIKEAQQ